MTTGLGSFEQVLWTRARRTAREQGVAFLLAVPTTLAFLGALGAMHDGYQVYREKAEQNRIARSAAVAALKSYAGAGCQFAITRNQETRVPFALAAAVQVVAVKGTTHSAIPGAIPLPTTAPTSLSLVDADQSDGGVSDVSIRFGGAKRNQDGSVTLEGLKPCVGDTSTPPTYSEQTALLGAEVTVKSLSSSPRTPLISRMFGMNFLPRSISKVTVTYDITKEGTSTTPFEIHG